MSHSQLEIYVRSSPLGEVGIHWRNISKPEQPNEEPDVLKQRVIYQDDGQKRTINSLIIETKPSLILARYENKVLLELTGLDATEDRSKRMGRRISEIVLWVEDASPEAESQLKKLAACALLSFWGKDSNFLTTIRSSIDFDGLNSFKAIEQQIKQLYTEAGTHLDFLLSKVSLGTINTSEAVWLTRQTIDDDRELYKLVNQISQASFPETKQPVVIIAEFKKKGDRPHIVYKGNVWKVPETEAEKRTSVSPQETRPMAQEVSSPKPKPTPTIPLIILGIILPVAIWLKIPFLKNNVTLKERSRAWPEACALAELGKKW